jgi:hypothetical protein
VSSAAVLSSEEQPPDSAPFAILPAVIAVSELDDDDDRDDEDGQYDSWDFEFHAPGEDDDDERRRYVTVANTTTA